MFNLAVIIATKDRALELGRLLKSFKSQEILPQEIVIVDASPGLLTLPDTAAFRFFKIKHVKADHACLPGQRNQGLTLLGKDADYVCFLDDDIVLHPGAVAAMAAFWDKAPADVGGAVFNIMNEKKPGSGVLLKKIFGTGSYDRGAVLPSGYNTLMCPASETRPVAWLFGGATVWRRGVFREFLFDDWYESTGLCEDLDFSYRVAKKYRLFVVAPAQVDHLTGTVTRRRNFWFGRTQIKNRWHFVKKHQELSKPRCLWAGIGQFLENLALGFLSFNPHYFGRATGNLMGFLELAAV